VSEICSHKFYEPKDLKKHNQTCALVRMNRMVLEQFDIERMKGVTSMMRYMSDFRQQSCKNVPVSDNLFIITIVIPKY